MCLVNINASGVMHQSTIYHINPGVFYFIKRTTTMEVCYVHASNWNTQCYWCESYVSNAPRGEKKKISRKFSLIYNYNPLKK